jgi:lipoprotein-anchoring transpeptidase ErfK/SrfK
MSLARRICSFAALVAAVAVTGAPARAQSLPMLFLRPPPAVITPQDRAPAMEPSDAQDEAQLAPRLRRQIVDYPAREPRGTIVVDTPHTFLYYVLGNGKAIRYGIGVGRRGFTWSGVKSIVRKTEWPDWYPPPEMIARQPYLPRMIAGGPGNPLGARALYIGGTEYRIHGTNDPSSIGKFVSSGCIRLTNDDAIDLYNRVTIGTKVVVLPMSSAAAESRERRGKPPAWQAKAQAAIAASADGPARARWQGDRPAALY